MYVISFAKNWDSLLDINSLKSIFEGRGDNIDDLTGIVLWGVPCNVYDFFGMTLKMSFIMYFTDKNIDVMLNL